ncbi:MAG: hypothetical protein O7G28_04795 [Deltaproteobacteria bacterium]|nr:hypothetical protein [Deltaproteobacteria bacterium]
MLFKIGNRGKFASKGLLGLRICRPIRLLQQRGVLEVLVLAERVERVLGLMVAGQQEATMGTVDKQSVVTMEELLISSLATEDALAKIIIEKGLITESEFMTKLSAERAGYQVMLRKMG